MSHLDTSLAKLAQQIPGATAIFNQYQLSFCCGGKKTLKEAIADAGLNQDEIVTALSNLSQRANDSADWKNATSQQVIDHLVSNYHENYPAQINELYRLADRVETVHGDSPVCPNGLADEIQQMAAVLIELIDLEQQTVFPLLQNEQVNNGEEVIAGITQAQQKLESPITRINELTNQVVTPKGACNTWRALYLGINAFKVDLQRHVQLENDVLIAGLRSTMEKASKTPVHGVDFCCGSCGG